MYYKKPECVIKLKVKSNCLTNILHFWDFYEIGHLYSIRKFGLCMLGERGNGAHVCRTFDCLPCRWKSKSAKLESFAYLTRCVFKLLEFIWHLFFKKSHVASWAIFCKNHDWKILQEKKNLDWAIIIVLYFILCYAMFYYVLILPKPFVGFDRWTYLLVLIQIQEYHTSGTS